MYPPITIKPTSNILSTHHFIKIFLISTAAVFYTPGAYAELNPSSYAALGNLVVGAGQTLTLNTTAGTYSVSGGGPAGNGVTQTQTGGPNVSVFTFNSISIDAAATVTVTGTQPIALLSQGSAIINPNITISAGGGSGGASLLAGSSTVGGATGGTSNLGGGGGGGTGGNGGAGSGGSIGGTSSAPSSLGTGSIIVGGAGGGGSNFGFPAASGGNGGGGIEIGALGDLTVNGVIASGSNTGNSGGGGGGGDITLITGGNLTLLGGALNANGGNGGVGGFAGGGGGGGQVALKGLSYTLGSGVFGSMTVNGGNSTGSTVGNAGILTYQPNTLIIPTGQTLNFTSSTLTVQAAAGQNTPQIQIIANQGLQIQSGGTVNMLTASQTITGLSGAGSLDLGSTGSLTLNTTSSNTFSGVVSDTGNLILSGTGSLILSGINTNAGTTTVNGGTLNIAGSMTDGSIIVNKGGTLTGMGALGNVNIQSGGTWAPATPGGTVGGIQNTGNIVFANGSTFMPYVNPNGTLNQVVSSGSATLNNANVSVQASQGTWQANTKYTLLTAAQGVNGTFGTVTSNLAFLTPSLSYDANDVYLNLAYAGAAGTGNTAGTYQPKAQNGSEQSVGAVLDAILKQYKGNIASMPSSLGTLFTELNQVSITAAPQALQTLSGALTTNSPSIGLGSMKRYQRVFDQKMNAARSSGRFAFLSDLYNGNLKVAAANGTRDFSVPLFTERAQEQWWLQVAQGQERLNADSNNVDYKSRISQMILGLNLKADQDSDWIFGGALGLSSEHLTWDDFSPATGDVTNIQAAISANYVPLQKDWYAGVTLSAQSSKTKLNRQVILGPFINNVTSTPVTFATNVKVEGGFDIEYKESLFQPFASLASSYMNQRGYSETGIGALQMPANTTTNVTSELGLRFGQALTEKDTLLLEGAWVHDMGNRTQTFNPSFVGSNQTFSVTSTALLRDSYRLGLTNNYAFNKFISGYFKLDTAFGNHITSGMFTMGISGRF